MDQGTRNPLQRHSSHPVGRTPASLDPDSDRSREDTGAQIAESHRRPGRARKEDIRDVIRACAIIGATILALRLYAAIASPTPL